MTHKYKKICLLLGVGSLSLTACQGGSQAGSSTGSGPVSSAQDVVKSYSDVAQYNTPEANCIVVAGQSLGAGPTEWWIGGSVTIKNSCSTNQAIDQTKVYMSSSLSDLQPGSFDFYNLDSSNSLISPMPGWEEHWVSTSVTKTQSANTATGFKDLELTLDLANKSAYLLPNGSTSFTFGYSPNGVNPGTVTFNTKAATPEVPAEPGVINLRLNTKQLAAACTAANPCNIPVHLIGQNGNFDQVIDTIDNSKANKVLAYTLKDIKSSDYRFVVNNSDLPVGISFTASNLFTLAPGATVNESANFTKVRVTTGTVTYQIVKPTTFTSQYSTAEVSLDRNDGSRSYTDITDFNPDQFSSVEKGTYILTARYGLADATLGKYAKPVKKAGIKVIAENSIDAGVLSYGNKNSNANVTVKVSGLASGETAGVKLTDNLAGVSYLFNDVSLVSGNNVLKLIESDDVVLNITAPTGYKAVAPVSYKAVKGGQINIQFEKIDSTPPVDNPESTPIVIPPGAVAFTNTSSFFLHLQNNAPNYGCPKTVKPGEHTYARVSTGGGWANSCYYLVCSSKDYKDGPGCTEPTPQGTDNEGGYIAWINLNPETHACTLPGYDTGTNTFECSMDAGGNFGLAFKSKVQTYSAGPKMSQTVTLPAIPTHYTDAPGLKYRGINLSGYEYKGTIGDAMYQRADLPEFKYFAEKGMNTLRLPIRWEYLIADNKPGYDNQITSTTLDLSKAHINTMYIAGLKDTVSKYLNAGVNVVIDMHTYLRYCKAGNDGTINIGQRNEPTDPPAQSGCTIVNKTEFAAVWGALANELKPLALQHDINNQVQLMFSLANEPFSSPQQLLRTQEVFDIEVTGAKAIRAAGLNNRIIFSGNYWDPLHHWTSLVPAGDAYPDDKPNGDIFTKANFEKAGIDVNGIGLEVHQYFDSNYSGRSEQCNVYADYADFVNKLGLTEMAKWMNDNHMQVQLTEFGAADNTVCKTDLGHMLRYLEEHALGQPGQENGGFTGWQLWRGNRHNNGGYGAFSYLDKEDYTVYGGNGTKLAVPNGTGINRGPANGLVDSLYFYHLTH